MADGFVPGNIGGTRRSSAASREPAAKTAPCNIVTADSWRPQLAATAGGHSWRPLLSAVRRQQWPCSAKDIKIDWPPAAQPIRCHRLHTHARRASRTESKPPATRGATCQTAEPTHAATAPAHTMLHCTASRHTMLHCTTPPHTMLHRTTPPHTMLHCTGPPCTMLHRTGHPASCCTTLPCVTHGPECYRAMLCATLRCVLCCAQVPRHAVRRQCLRAGR